MRNKIIVILFFLILLGVSANAQMKYKNANEKVSVGGKIIIVKSTIYLNIMPGIIENSKKKDCSKNGNLIAPVTIETENGEKLPQNLKIVRLWFKNNDIWRGILFNKDETELNENTINSIGRDCAGGNLDAEKNITAVAEIQYKGKSYFVRSSQNLLFTTH